MYKLTNVTKESRAYFNERTGRWGELAPGESITLPAVPNLVQDHPAFTISEESEQVTTTSESSTALGEENK